MRKKLKIVFYTDTYSPAIDGVVNSIKQSRRELERRGHKVYIFTAGTAETAAFEKSDSGLTVLRGIRLRRYPQYTIALKPVFSTKLKDLHPDIIHSHTPFNMGILAVHAKKLTGARLVSTFHTLVFSDELLAAFLSRNRIIKALGKFALMRYLKWFYQKSDVVIAPSVYIRDMLKSKLGLKGRIDVIPEGVEFMTTENNLSKSSARKKIGIHTDGKILLYLGRVSPEKNLALLLKYGKQLEDSGFTIIIAGDGPYMSECIALSKKYGLKTIRFPGFIKEDMKRYYYAAADVFCNPSLFDTQSLVDLEAMSHSLPILVPKSSAQTDFLSKGKCGEAFNGVNGDDLVKNALKIANSPRAYHTRRVAEKYDIKHTVDKLLQTYYSLIESRH